MSPRPHRHPKPRHGATRRATPRVSPRRWLARLDGWLTEPRLNRLVDLSVLTALITAGLALAMSLLAL